MSEKCVSYRALKHPQKTKQKQLKVRIKLSVDARTLKNLASPLRY